MPKHKAQAAQSPPERQALKAAIAAHADAVEQSERAQRLLDKANALHDDLHAQLADYKDLDAAIAAARAQQMKVALAGDAQCDLSEPEGFAAKIIARTNCANISTR